MTFIFTKFYAGGGLGETGIRYKKQFLQEVPFIKPSQESKEIIEDLIDQIQEKKKHIINTDTSDLESQIDELVMDLYGLNEEEKEVIRNS